jgi:hypothetical protein
MFNPKNSAVGATMLAMALLARADDGPAAAGGAGREVVWRVRGLACPAVQGLG